MPYFHVQKPVIIFVFIFSSLLITSCQRDNSSHAFSMDKAKDNWNTNNHTWKESQLKTLEYGHHLYQLNCGGCHGAKGQGQHLIGAPALKNNSLMKGDPQQHIKIVLQGKPKRSMPAYKNILNNKNLAAIISYERNAWGNNSYQIIKESQIQQLRK